MYQNPTLLPQISNRETLWLIIQLADDDTGDLILLTDTLGNSLYVVTCEIVPARPRGHAGGYGPSPYYDDCCDPVITATLSNYISIIDTGTIQILIPKSVVTKLRAQTYDVFLTIDPVGQDDGRQLMIGRLPVLYGGRNT